MPRCRDESGMGMAAGHSVAVSSPCPVLTTPGGGAYSSTSSRGNKAMVLPYPPTPAERLRNLFGQRNRADGPEISAADQGGGHDRRMREGASQAEGDAHQRDRQDGEQESDIRRVAHAT